MHKSGYLIIRPSLVYLLLPITGNVILKGHIKNLIKSDVSWQFLVENEMDLKTT